MTTNQKSLVGLVFRNLRSCFTKTDNKLDDEIKDYRIFKEGDEFPPLKKKIHILIVVETTYIVFLDEKLYVHWYYNNDYFTDEYQDFVEGYGDVLGRQAELEGVSRLLLKGNQLEEHHRMLGEAIARLLDDRSVKYANRMLDKAASFLEARSHERARNWYLTATLPTTFVLVAFGLLFWKLKEAILGFLNFDPGAADIFLGAAMGSIGASISVLLRSNRLKLDPSAGPWVHYFEGIIRILVGAFAGMLFVLAVKSNILLSTINQLANARTTLLILSLVAGASEALLPSLIDQISGTLVGSAKKAQVPEKSEESFRDEEKEKDKENRK